MTLTELEALRNQVELWKSYGVSSKFPIHTSKLEALIKAAMACKRIPDVLKQ